MVAREADPVVVERALSVLRDGGCVALPTETVYGLAVDARSEAAIRHLFAIKGRPADRPLPVLLPDAGAMGGWAEEVPEAARRLADAFWPGPLTLVLRRAPGLPDVLTAGGPTIGLRVPDHPAALAVLRAFGDGLATPSANRHGTVSATSAEGVRRDLGEDVDLVVDGGPCEVGVESTVVDVSGPRPRVLRAGAVGREDLQRALGSDLPLEGGEAGAVTAFRPGTRTEIVPREAIEARARGCVARGEEVVVLVTPGLLALPEAVRRVGLPADEGERRRSFYVLLREADAAGADRVLVEEPPDTAWGRAIRERLRAASP
ncbi:MAG: L-threonylcarbamoyladenylate synthase [Myxococcota bacterium]